MEKFDYTVYTDGCYSRKHDEGAFAYVILGSDGNEVRRGSYKISGETNNRAELKAIIAALHFLPSRDCRVLVVSDSKYAMNTIAGKWARNANQDLFPISDRIISEKALEVEYRWVKGHSGVEYNELCDRLCVDVLGYDPREEYFAAVERRNQERMHA